MKEFDLRRNNGGRRYGAGRPRKEKPIKKAVYIPKEKLFMLKNMGFTNFNYLVNQLIDNHIAKFNTF